MYTFLIQSPLNSIKKNLEGGLLDFFYSLYSVFLLTFVLLLRKKKKKESQLCSNSLIQWNLLHSLSSFPLFFIVLLSLTQFLMSRGSISLHGEFHTKKIFKISFHMQNKSQLLNWIQKNNLFLTFQGDMDNSTKNKKFRFLMNISTSISCI